MLDWPTNTRGELVQPLTCYARDTADTCIHTRGRGIEDRVCEAGRCANGLVDCSGRGVDAAADGAGLLRRELAWGGMSLYYG